jgi:bis(5'-nucleosyl)-tetraphosphatase (symmetrical)
MSVKTPLNFVIGDVQGCYESLCKLLKRIDEIDPNAQLYFAGDLVNRGPDSLATLRLIKNLGKRAKTVLGNHDLHLLAVAHDIRSTHHSDTLDDILNAPDREELLSWLRHRPLAISIASDNIDALLIHAGVFPQWNKEKTLALAKEVEAQLQGDNYLTLLQNMYGNTPAKWSDNLQSYDRWRCIINALTRMRYCYPDGSMDFLIKENTQNAPEDVLPWFDLTQRKTRNTCVIFGHWSTLGLVLKDNLISLDTGCVWGGKLTAVSLTNNANERSVVQVDCEQQCVPKLKN